ncbi:MAG: GAF domain-containing protein [Capsulimonadaceae bacterium]|nr:GAF domain-containing protein [Capsulimonadaceae bacterium]
MILQERDARRHAEAVAAARVDELNKKQRLVQLLLAVSVAANEAYNVSDAFRATLRHVCDFTGWPIGHVYIASEDDPDLYKCSGIWLVRDYKRFHSFMELTKQTTYATGQGLPGLVAQKRAPVLPQDFKLEQQPRYEIGEQVGIKSALAVPVIADDRVVAVLEFFIGEIVHLDDSLDEVFATIGKQLGRTFERQCAEDRINGLNHMLEQRVNRLAALRDIDHAITTGVDLRTTLAVLTRHAQRRLGVNGARILAYDHRSGDLSTAAQAIERSCELPGPEARQFDDPALIAARSGVLVSLDDLEGLMDNESLKIMLDEHWIKSYFSAPMTASGQVIGIVEVWSVNDLKPDEDWIDYLQAIAGQAAIAMSNRGLLRDLERTNIELTVAYEATIEGWSRALDLRDKETEGHSRRVTEMSVQLAQELGLPHEQIVQIRRGALLHDIGKMGVPDHILLKPGALTEEETRIMRKHTQHAYDMLSPIDFLKPALEIPTYHHEKWDGTGYPYGLKGHDIPLAARIFAVVDVFDALSSDRPYRSGWPIERVIEHIRSLAGTHFDIRVLKAFLRMKGFDNDLDALEQLDKSLARAA